MSLPTTETIFAEVRASDSWVQYPLIDQGDPNAKIYNMTCSVNLDDYTPIALSTTMSSAASAGVISLPFDSNITAYHIGDFNHNYRDGKLIEFVRKFATVPAARTRVKGSRIFTFPGYDTAEAEARIKFTKTSRYRVKYSYLIGGAFTFPEVFLRPTRTNSSSTKYFVDYVSNIVLTTPTRTAYEAKVIDAGASDSSWLTVDVSSKEWHGNIYVMEERQVVAL
tara:strand:- start:403 stop:1071 length:669 start_codon:yes stop_codon:yes gene_type:complete